MCRHKHIKSLLFSSVCSQSSNEQFTTFFKNSTLILAMFGKHNLLKVWG